MSMDVLRFHYGVPRVFSKLYRFPKKRSVRLPSGRPTLKVKQSPVLCVLFLPCSEQYLSSLFPDSRFLELFEDDFRFSIFYPCELLLRWKYLPDSFQLPLSFRSIWLSSPTSAHSRRDRILSSKKRVVDTTQGDRQPWRH
jgi:hypothetical protein